MKKKIAILLLASFILTNLTPLSCLAINKKSSNEPKKVSITKTHKQRQKSDEFKYEYINYDWWKNFNDGILNGYIDKAIKNNYDLKSATIAVDEYYQAVRMQFANELPMAGVGFSPAFSKQPGTTSSGWMFATPAIANYELDLFLKNRDKTKASEREYEASLQDERAAYISIASAVGTTYLNIVKLDKMIELQEDIVKDRKLISKPITRSMDKTDLLYREKLIEISGPKTNNPILSLKSWYKAFRDNLQYEKNIDNIYKNFNNKTNIVERFVNKIFHS